MTIKEKIKNDLPSEKILHFHENYKGDDIKNCEKCDKPIEGMVTKVNGRFAKEGYFLCESCLVEIKKEINNKFRMTVI